MAQPENVIELSRKLLAVIDRYVSKLPRERKFTIGNRLLDRAVTVLEECTGAYYCPKADGWP